MTIERLKHFLYVALTLWGQQVDLVLFFPAAVPIHHVNPNPPPSLVLPTTSYREYFARIETNTFRGRYTAVLAPYAIDLVNAAITPVDAAQLIYVADQEVVTTALPAMSSRGKGGGGGVHHDLPLSFKLSPKYGSVGITMGWRLLPLKG